MTTTETDTSTEPKIDLYREVHKGLRLALFELAEEAGAIDPSDTDDVAAFAELFGEIDMMLAVHHDHEDGEHLADLIATHAPEAGQQIDAAHARIDEQLDELRPLVGGLTGPAPQPTVVYDAVVQLVADYLDHMRHEETVVMPALQDAATPDDLMAITMAIRSSVPPPQMCVFLRYMLPAMNPDERTSTLGGMKMGAPGEVFEMFWNVAGASLSETDLAVVAERIGA